MPLHDVESKMDGSRRNVEGRRVARDQGSLFIVNSESRGGDRGCFVSFALHAVESEGILSGFRDIAFIRKHEGADQVDQEYPFHTRVKHRPQDAHENDVLR
jgi:hypothetical protein